MKYIYGTIVTLTAMMLTMTACTAESNETATGQTRQMLLDATVGNGATTRTVSTSLQTTSIYVGNTVGAFIYREGQTTKQNIDGEDYGYENKQFTRVSTTTQLYSPEQPLYPMKGTGTQLNADIFAYAPYNAGYTSLTTAQSFAVQTDQSSDANYIASDLLWTKINTTTATKEADNTHYTIFTTPFNHKLTQVQVTVIYGDGLPAGTLNNIPVKLVNVLTGGTIDLSNGNITATTRDASGVTVFTYKDAVADPATPAVTTGTAIIYPHTAAELTTGGAIQIEVNGFTYTAALKTYDATENPTGIQELLAGHKYTYNVTVSSTGITFSAAIQPWNVESDRPITPDLQ